MKSHPWQRQLLLGFLCACGGLNCASGGSERNSVVGIITPEYFRFRDIVPDDDPDEAAQFAAASMANRAARSVLSDAHPGEIFAVLCKRFKDIYQPMLRAKIQGALVSECTTEGVDVVLFGITTTSGPTP